MNTRAVFKAFSNSLLAKTLKSGMLPKLCCHELFPYLLTFKFNVCTNLLGLPNLPAYPPIYMYLDYILLYPIYEHTYLGYLIGQHSLDTEANRFYDRNHQMYDAALLTRCYTQHALRPVIDSESNPIRSFIKIPFINKGIDFIDLPSIFQDKSVTQSIPTYFQNSEPPIICYKYNKPIRNTIFNFNKLVSDLDIHANTPKS